MKYININNKHEIFVKNRLIKHRFDNLVTKKVNVSKDQLDRCKEYAQEYINENKDYSKLVPKEIKNIDLQKEIAMQRVFANKVAECGFLNYLAKENISSDVLQKNKIDIKVALDKDIHTRLIIPKEEFISKNKHNYYVGVHLNAQILDKKDNVKRHFIKDIYDIKEVQIYGYLDYKFTNELKFEIIKNKLGKKEFKFFTKKSDNYDKKSQYANLLGEECKWYYLDRLMPIENLMKKFK